MSQTKIKCVYPDCNKNQIPHQGVYGLCPEHSRFCSFFIWLMENFKISVKDKKAGLEKREVKTDSGLWLP